MHLVDELAAEAATGGTAEETPPVSLTACVQGVSRQLAAAEITDEALTLEDRYISYWRNFAWTGDPNVAPAGRGSSNSGVSAAAPMVASGRHVMWPARAAGGGGQVLVLDTPEPRAGGREALPGEILWQWFGSHGLHAAYAGAKARIL